MRNGRIKKELNRSAIALLLASGLFLGSGAVQAAKLEINVTGVKFAKGIIAVCVWQKPDNFPECDRKAIFRRAVVNAAVGSVKVTFPKIPAGNYAVSVGHDQNADGKLERHWLFKYPTEGAGVSNMTEPPRGTPEFKDAVFTITEPAASVNVIMHYP